MAEYTDKKTTVTDGYTETNIGVYPFGSLPLNEVFGYGGVGVTMDNTTDTNTTFSKETVTYETNFTKNTTNE